MIAIWTEGDAQQLCQDVVAMIETDAGRVNKMQKAYKGIFDAVTPPTIETVKTLSKMLQSRQAILDAVTARSKEDEDTDEDSAEEKLRWLCALPGQHDTATMDS